MRDRHIGRERYLFGEETIRAFIARVKGPNSSPAASVVFNRSLTIPDFALCFWDDCRAT